MKRRFLKIDTQSGPNVAKWTAKMNRQRDDRKMSGNLTLSAPKSVKFKPEDKNPEFHFAKLSKTNSNI